jgi:hypothetical protein
MGLLERRIFIGEIGGQCRARTCDLLLVRNTLRMRRELHGLVND